MNNLLIIGASGHGKVIADIAMKNGYSTIEFLDDNNQLYRCGKYNVIGKVNDFVKFKSYDFAIGIGDAVIRKKFFNMLKSNGCKVVSLVHPNAVIAEDVNIGIGCVVMGGTVINSGSNIGNGVIINTSSSVDHDCVIEDFVHIAVGAHVAGNVVVGKNTWIGAGATIINNIRIHNNCLIGAGATVISDITVEGTYIGTPAKLLIK